MIKSSELLTLIDGVKFPKHVECTWEYYDALTTKDEDTLYFILDRNTIYKGSTKYSEVTIDAPYLTVEVLEDECTIGFSLNTIQYSTDLNTWNELAVGSTVSANAGDKVYFKASGLVPVRWNPIDKSGGIGTFTVSKKFNLSGNCNSMLFGDDAATNLDLTGYDYAFYGLFQNCNTLQSVSRTFLPATTLADSDSCYYKMFSGCTSLTTAPELPATTLASNCYNSMFIRCTALTEAPAVLPATTLVGSCYSYMFAVCTALTTAPELPATTLTSGCYRSMFSGCTSLKTAPSVLPATTLSSDCYRSMFHDCTSLTTAPELPATTLSNYCYQFMFQDCTNLNYIKMLATDISASSCLNNWVSGVSSTGTFVKNADATWTGNIPSDWTVEYPLNISGGTTDQILAKKSDTTHDTEWKSVKTINGTSILGTGDITIESGENNVQSNWTETDTSSDAYILNKPTLGTAAAKDVASDGNASTSQVVMGNDTRLSDARPASDVYSWAKASSKPTYTASEVGAISSTLKGANNGVAELDSNGKVPSSQLPSYVDDVLEYSSLNEFPTTGETGKIYIAIDTNKTYRWSGSTYVEISSSLALGETSSTAYRGDRGKVAYDHSQTTGNPHNTAFADIANKPTTIAGYGITDAFSGNYNDLTNKPDLAAVATSGDYNDLLNRPDEIIPYLTIEVLEDECTIGFSTNTIQYSTDLDNWNDLAVGSTVSANAGDKVYFKASELVPGTSYPNVGIGTFTVDKKFNLSGNVMSMLFGDDAATNLDLTDYDYAFYMLFYNCTTLQSVSRTFLSAMTLANYCYAIMFYNCTALTTAPELPATTLALGCYYGMFYNCTALTTAPELPATTLSNQCYTQMFQGCTTLTTAPSVLPATTLANQCYTYMFQDCTSLTAAPKLPATTLAIGCYGYMFQSCTSLTTAPELPATTLALGCYQYMFRGCTALTTAPELPATTLADYCYREMFYYCSNLNYIKMLGIDISAYNHLSDWVTGVASTGTFVKNPDATWDVTGESGIPEGWTVEYPLDISGGTTDQILTKKSDTTHDTEWKSVKTINGISILGGGDISTAYHQVNHGTSDITFALTPNVLHVWDEVTELSLTLADPTDTTVANEYVFQFTSGATATTLTLPNTIKWLETPSIESDKVYQVSILNNCGTILGFV